MKNNLSLFFLTGICATFFTTASSHPLNDENDDDDTDNDLKKIVDMLSVNYPKTTISLSYNNGTFTISSTVYCNDLNLLITNAVDGQQYTLNTNLSENEENIVLDLPDGTYTISVTGEEYYQLLFLTIEGGIGQCSNQ